MADEPVLTGEIVPADRLERKGRDKVRKGGSAPDPTGSSQALALRAALLEAAGYTPDDLRLARDAKLEALGALDRLGNPDHVTRLKAASQIDDVILPTQHGNAGGSGKSVLELDAAPWLRKLMEGKADRT